METRNIMPWTWSEAAGFVQAKEISGVEKVLICSGQTSVDADGNAMHAGDMAAQIAQALDNLKTVLDDAGFSMTDIVRLNYYVTDLDLFLESEEKGAKLLVDEGVQPTSTLLGVTALFLPELMVEIEVTAMK